jgi:hypothetical protein
VTSEKPKVTICSDHLRGFSGIFIHARAVRLRRTSQNRRYGLRKRTDSHSQSRGLLGKVPGVRFRVTGFAPQYFRRLGDFNDFCRSVVGPKWI